LNEEVVDEWGEHIHEQNRQHHAFWVSWVNHANQNDQHTDKEPVNQFATIRE
jgi:hypothetical protein